MNSKTKPVKFGLIVTGVLSLVMLYTSCSKDETITNSESHKNILLNEEVVSVDPATQIPYGPENQNQVYYGLKLDGDTGTCPYGPGFCPDYDSPLTTGDYVLGTDASGSISLNASNNTLTLNIGQIREGWFDEGGYIDGTFTAPELELGEEIAELLGVNSIILIEGVYDMIEDEATGGYKVTVDVIIE
ncbi:hypothetical protein KFE94_01935 [bacterium SCSIO 12643]|nr:hypothetical protein KFE94_01935 [bacterium SCSIO 12643]